MATDKDHVCRWNCRKRVHISVEVVDILLRKLVFFRSYLLFFWCSSRESSVLWGVIGILLMKLVFFWWNLLFFWCSSREFSVLWG